MFKVVVVSADVYELFLVQGEKGMESYKEQYLSGFFFLSMNSGYLVISPFKHFLGKLKAGAAIFYNLKHFSNC